MFTLLCRDNLQHSKSGALPLEKYFILQFVPRLTVFPLRLAGPEIVVQAYADIR